jgi:hypothetical protein
MGLTFPRLAGWASRRVSLWLLLPGLLVWLAGREHREILRLEWRNSTLDRLGFVETLFRMPVFERLDRASLQADGLGMEVTGMCLPLMEAGRLTGYVVATYSLQNLLINAVGKHTGWMSAILDVSEHRRTAEPPLKARKKGRMRAIHARIARVRKDAMHKFSTRLVKENAAIFVGNVSGKAPIKTKMASSVLDAGWSTAQDDAGMPAPRPSMPADPLDISVRTVEVHRARVFEKMGVKPAVEPANLLRNL